MRYYAIKISGGSSTATPATTSGSAGLPVASNGRVAGPVIAQLAVARNARNARRLGFRSLGAEAIEPPTEGPALHDYVAANPQPFVYGGMDPEIVARSQPGFNQPAVPASVQPVVTAPIGGSGVATGSGTGGAGGGTSSGTGTAATGSGPQGAQFISVVNGQNDPGALDIEFDINLPVGNSGGTSSAWIKIRGIPFSMIAQSSQFNKCKLEMWAGYTNGLPLANLQVPHQGLILSGMIWPALGNWILNDLSLEFFVTPGDPGGVGGPTNPKNIVHNIPANQPFSTGLKNALQTAFPNSTVNVNISDKIKLAYNDYGFYQSIEQYADYIKTLSHDLLGTPQTTGYGGVRIYSQGNIITAKDNTKSGNAIALQFEDFVGQPTWIGANKISVKTLLRGDISPPSGETVQITLPANTLATVASPDQAKIGQNNNVLAFQGTWTVTGVRHIGKFRSPSMDSWVTVIEAVTEGSSGGGGGGDSTPSGPANTGGELPFSPPSGAAGGGGGGGIGHA